MNFKKTVLYLLLSILLLIFIYNYILPYLFIQNTGIQRMGMHMGQGTVTNTAYYFSNFFSIIIMTIIVIIGLVLFNTMISHSRNNTCKKCGQTIESDQWKICPRCGTYLPNKGDDRK